MGSAITITRKGLSIQGGSVLKGLIIDANDIPDLLPTLAVIGAYAQGKTDIINVRQARIKGNRSHPRHDRGAQALRRTRRRISRWDDHLSKQAPRGSGKSYGDHRTVMALAVAGLLAEGVTLIEDSSAIDKTFPTFVTWMRALGAKMESSMRPKSIILIGFKHVGKTVIGRALADQLKWPFRDLDEAIEQLFTKETQAHKTCRQIMKAHGSAYFRELEKER